MFVFSTKNPTNNPGLPKIYEPKDEVKDEFKRGAFICQGWISMPKIGGHGEVACGLKPKSINETGGQVALGFFESSTSRSGLMRTPEGDLEVELSAR